MHSTTVVQEQYRTGDNIEFDSRDGDVLFGPPGNNDGDDIDGVFSTTLRIELGLPRRNEEDTAELPAAQAREWLPHPLSQSSPSNRSGRKETGGLQSHNEKDTNNDKDGHEHDEDDNSILDDPNDEDYADGTDAVVSEVEERRRRRKLQKREGNTESFENTTSSVAKEPLLSNVTNSLSQDLKAASFRVTKESDAIVIRGWLLPMVFESKIALSFVISPDLSEHSLATACRLVDTNGSGCEDALKLKSSPQREHVSGRIRRHFPFSSEEDTLLVRLKEVEDRTWDEIAKKFPGRSKGTLQVRYSTKLNTHPKEQQRRRKRQRLS